MELSIDHLFQHPDDLGTVAGWIYDEFWRDKEGYSAEVFIGLLQQAASRDAIPLSLVAYADGRPVGTVNLIENDDEARAHLRPWLAALIVIPEYRRQGIGEALVRCLLAEAQRLGVRRLYLGTHIPTFYERLGATIHQRVHETHWVMEFAIPA